MMPGLRSADVPKIQNRSPKYVNGQWLLVLNYRITRMSNGKNAMLLWKQA